MIPHPTAHAETIKLQRMPVGRELPYSECRSSSILGSFLPVFNGSVTAHAGTVKLQRMPVGRELPYSEYRLGAVWLSFHHGNDSGIFLDGKVQGKWVTNGFAYKITTFHLLSQAFDP
jgi:hypothetical protein